MDRRDLVYPPVIGAARLVFRALGLRIELTGDQHVPVHGPVVIASNHVSFLDFTLVGLAARRSRRYLRFLARHDIWAHPIAGPLMSGMHHVPVDRHAPAAAYLRARSLLRDGEAIGVFPEAGVSSSYTVRPLMPGAAALAAETGAPLVPMAIWGPQRIATARSPVDLHRGRPVSLLVGPAAQVPPDADLVETTSWLGRTLQGLLDGLQRLDRHRPRPGENTPWHPAHLGGHAPSASEALRHGTAPRSAVPVTWRPGGPDQARHAQVPL